MLGPVTRVKKKKKSDSQPELGRASESKEEDEDKSSGQSDVSYRARAQRADHTMAAVSPGLFVPGNQSGDKFGIELASHVNESREGG